MSLAFIQRRIHVHLHGELQATNPASSRRSDHAFICRRSCKPQTTPSVKVTGDGNIGGRRPGRERSRFWTITRRSFPDPKLTSYRCFWTYQQPQGVKAISSPRRYVHKSRPFLRQSDVLKFAKRFCLLRRKPQRSKHNRSTKLVF